MHPTAGSYALVKTFFGGFYAGEEIVLMPD